MDAKRNLLILKMDLLDRMREIDTVKQAVLQTAAGLVEVSVVDCEQPEDIIDAAADGKPDWVHIVGRTNDQQLIFSGDKQEDCKIDRIRFSDRHCGCKVQKAIADGIFKEVSEFCSMKIIFPQVQKGI